MYVCMPHVCLTSPEPEWGHWISWNCSFRRWYTTKWVLGNKLAQVLLSAEPSLQTHFFKDLFVLGDFNSDWERQHIGERKWLADPWDPPNYVSLELGSQTYSTMFGFLCKCWWSRLRWPCLHIEHFTHWVILSVLWMTLRWEYCEEIVWMWWVSPRITKPLLQGAKECIIFAAHAHSTDPPLIFKEQAE